MSTNLADIPGATGAQYWLTRFSDVTESYGSEVIKDFVKHVGLFESVLDIGAGIGRDLSLAKSVSSGCETIAVEAGRERFTQLKASCDRAYQLDIERQPLPLPDESVDLVIANQVLEHTKEIFWIFDEFSRVLRIGGHLIIGVPNLASLHNRVLLLFGGHPTQIESFSAHIRGFTKPDLRKFLAVCFPNGYELRKFAGSQFYPFPRLIARPLAQLFPSMAFSIFLLLRKRRAYRGEFVEFPAKAQLETNFYVGDRKPSKDWFY